MLLLVYFLMAHPVHFLKGKKHPTCSVGVITLSVIIRSMISQLINLTDV